MRLVISFWFRVVTESERCIAVILGQERGREMIRLVNLVQTSVRNGKIVWRNGKIVSRNVPKQSQLTHRRPATTTEFACAFPTFQSLRLVWCRNGEFGSRNGGFGNRNGCFGSRNGCIGSRSCWFWTNSSQPTPYDSSKRFKIDFKKHRPWHFCRRSLVSMSAPAVSEYVDVAFDSITI